MEIYINIAHYPELAVKHFLAGGSLPSFDEFELMDRKLDGTYMVFTIDGDAFAEEYPGADVEEKLMDEM